MLQCKFKHNHETEVESRSRSLKLQSIDGFFESRKFEKVKEAISLSVYKRNTLAIDKIVSLRRKFSKVCSSCPGL